MELSRVSAQHAQGLDPRQAHAYDPSAQKAKKDQHLKFTLLSDIVSSKSTWASRDPGVLVYTSRVNLESIRHMKETRFKGYIAYDFHSDGMSQTGKSRETQSGWVVVRAGVARNFQFVLMASPEGHSSIVIPSMFVFINSVTKQRFPLFLGHNYLGQRRKEKGLRFQSFLFLLKSPRTTII